MLNSFLYELSLQNTQVAQSLNQIRSSLLTRLKASRVSNKSIYWLNLYFSHEIFTSKPLQIIYITNIFNRILAVAILFSVSKNLRLQAQACQDLAQCILYNQPYQPSQESQKVLGHLESSLKD